MDPILMVIVGAIISLIVGLFGWLIKSSLIDLKKGQSELKDDIEKVQDRLEARLATTEIRIDGEMQKIAQDRREEDSILHTRIDNLIKETNSTYMKREDIKEMIKSTVQTHVGFNRQ